MKSGTWFASRGSIASMRRPASGLDSVLAQGRNHLIDVVGFQPQRKHPFAGFRDRLPGLLTRREPDLA
jgi:hypothetical protein